MKKQLLKLLAVAFLMMLGSNMSVSALETYDFQELCMVLGKGGPWAVNDGADAGFTINDATMHFLGDYTEQGFTWNQRFAYEFVEGRGKFTMRNKSNKKDSNCGMFSWDYAHYFSILGLKNGDKVTITIPTGSVTFVSETAEGISEGDAVASNTTYTISTTEESTRLDIQMAKATLIAKIVIEPYGVETVPEISMSQKTLKLVPGATGKLSASVTPSTVATQWKSSDEAVATVAEDGTVTAVAAGTATISCYWESEISDATAEDACEVTVADVDLSAYTKTALDFTTMGDVTLVEGEKAGAIYNAANSKNNDVFFCTNEGLEMIAIQAALSDNKGWSIKDGEGLVLGSKAGRCAAVAGIKQGQIVEFIYTGNAFYTKSDKSDDGIAKTALNEAIGRAIFLADESGMIGFELDKGNAVKQINIYSSPLIDAKAQLQEAIDKLKALGVAPLANAIAAAEAALNAEDATVASIAAAAKKLDEDVKKFGKDALGKAILLSAQLNDPDVSAAANTAMPVYLNDNATTDDYIEALFGILNAVQPKIDSYAPQVIEFAERYNYPDLKAAIEGLIGAVEDKDIDKVIAGATSMLTLIKETATDVKTKLEPYLEVLDDEELKADVEAIASLVNGSSTDFAAIIAAMQKAVDQFLKASAAFVAKVDAVVADGADDAKLIEALNTAKATLANTSSTIVQIGSAIQALIKAYKEYEIATGIETVSIAAQNAVVYDLQGRRVLNDRKGIFIINGKKVVIK